LHNKPTFLLLKHSVTLFAFVCGLVHFQISSAQVPDAGALQQQLQREVEQNRANRAHAPSGI
jgi:hypothetical protein